MKLGSFIDTETCQNFGNLKKTELWKTYQDRLVSTLSSLICSNEPNEISKALYKVLHVVFITIVCVRKVKVLVAHRKMNLF